MSRKLACPGVRLGGRPVQDPYLSGKLTCQGPGKETCPEGSHFRKLTFAGLGGCLVLEGDLSGAWGADPGVPLWFHFGTISTHLGASEASGVCETTCLGVCLVWEADFLF